MTVSASALSYESPVLPTDGSNPGLGQTFRVAARAYEIAHQP
jgi:hypothetical protein